MNNFYENTFRDIAAGCGHYAQNLCFIRKVVILTCSMCPRYVYSQESSHIENPLWLSKAAWGFTIPEGYLLIVF